MYWYNDKVGREFKVVGIRNNTDYVVENEGTCAHYLVSKQDCEVLDFTTYLQDGVEQLKDRLLNNIFATPTTGWSDAHYASFSYTLTEDDKKAGSIKIDPYFVAKQWGLGMRDDSGILFHNLKTIARFGDKNSREREIVALYKQVKRLAEIEGVVLPDGAA